MVANESSMARPYAPFLPARAPFGAQQRRILCANDLSMRSDRAVKAAAVLANRLGAQLTVMHVVPARSAERSAGTAHDRLRTQLSTSGLNLDSIPVLAVREGDVARAIADVARESGADLIVMGAQRKRALAPILGTTAERVIALAHSAVLIVRSNGSLHYDRVVVAAELEPTFGKVMGFADRWSFLDAPRVSVVHGFASPYQGPLYAEGFDIEAARRQIDGWKRTARRHLQEMLRLAGIDSARFDVRIEERRPLGVVRRVLPSGRSRSLVIMGATAHNALTRIIRGSLVNDVLLNFDCDVLICPHRKQRRTLH
jgi:nucleotide-binding universal stress UspA family protein